MDHKQEKHEIELRYANPIEWILQMIESGQADKITKFDILNARHEMSLSSFHML